MEPTQSERPKVMDRASAFLRQQFRLIPVEFGPSIQSPRHLGASTTVPEPQEVGMPQAEVASRAEQATPDLGMVPADEEVSDVEWSLEGFAKEDYGSFKDRCRDYLRTMKATVLKGTKLTNEAMTPQREWHLICKFICGVCP